MNSNEESSVIVHENTNDVDKCITNSDTEDILNNSENSISSKNASSQNENLHVLNWKQVKRLDDLLNNIVPIHGRGNFPTLNIKLKDFIRNLSKRLVENRVRIRDILINGGVASNILADEQDYEFSDIDIVFSCDLLQLESMPESPFSVVTDQNIQTDYYSMNLENSYVYCCEIIKQTVLECLLDYLPNQNNQVFKLIFFK